MTEKKIDVKKKRVNARDTKPNNSTSDSQLNAKKKFIIGHNFSLKFPLKSNCRIPFSENYFNYTKLPRGKFNVRFDFKHSKGFIRQTNKSLIIFPRLERKEALPRNSFRLKALLSDKAFAIAKELMQANPGLCLKLPSRPSTQEYAIRDAYAKEIDFTYENEVGKIDKSVHVDETGFENSGGEIDWKTPEFADAYIRMPIVFKKAMETFEANMASHVRAIREIAFAAEEQAQAAVGLKNAVKRLSSRARFHTSLRKSATVRGVS